MGLIERLRWALALWRIPRMREWAPAVARLPWDELFETDTEGWSYASPVPDFIDWGVKEDREEFDRRYEWALAEGLVERREARYGIQTRINDENWWHRAGEALARGGGMGA